MQNYGVGVLMIMLGVAVAAGAGAVAVTLLPVDGAGAFWVGPAAAGVTWPPCDSGQASRSAGKFVQLLESVQLLTTRGLISGPLPSTTCLPLFTSTVVQRGSAS